MYAICKDCGHEFYADETWKVRCIGCWRKWKNRDSRNENSDHFFQLLQAKMRIQELEQEREELLLGGTNELEAALAEKMRVLISLVHPDKHGGSQTANDITVWLLDIKQKAANPGRHDGF